MTDNEPRPLVSIVLPAYNEAGILEENVVDLQRYLETLSDRYRWEMLIVNDGSSDGTGEIAEALAVRFPNIRVLHHGRNRGLGQGFRTAFENFKGDYVVTLDIDMSYSADHIERLLDTLIREHRDIVLASPYMPGGRISSVPLLRKVFSIGANKFLSLFSAGKISTLTCMVRAYRGDFVRSLVLRATGMEVMPETIYKAQILRGRLGQIPAHLDWGRQVAAGGKRSSSMRLLKHTFATLLAGFVLRPFMFFVVPGLLLLGFAAWTNFWMFMHFIDAYRELSAPASDRVSLAVALAYDRFPHTFIVGLLSLMLAIQLISLGILALQSKNYFEEIYNLGVETQRRLQGRPGPRE